MKTVLIFQISRLRNAEFYHLINRVLMLFGDKFVSYYGFIRLIAVLKEMFEHLDNSFLNSKTNPLTPEMKAVDKKRDSYFIGLNQTITSFARIGNEEEVEASLALQKIIKPYKKAYRLSMVENTAQVRAYIVDLSSSASMRSINILKLADRLPELEDLNEEFDDLFFARTEGQEHKETFKKLRKEIVPALHDVFNRLNSLYLIAEEDGNAGDVEELGEQIDRVNVIITEIQDTVIRRVTRRENKKKDVEVSPQWKSEN